MLKVAFLVFLCFDILQSGYTTTYGHSINDLVIVERGGAKVPTKKNKSKKYHSSNIRAPKNLFLMRNLYFWPKIHIFSSMFEAPEAQGTAETRRNPNNFNSGCSINIPEILK